MVGAVARVLLRLIRGSGWIVRVARGTRVIGINLLESRDRVLSAIEEKRIGYTVALDHDGAVGRKYGAEAIPNIFVIDEHGRIVDHRYTPPER